MLYSIFSQKTQTYFHFFTIEKKRTTDYIPDMIVFDKMQRGYQYEYSEDEGENFAPDFCPALTPKQMLELGVFEGHYMNDCQREFPHDWFQNARINAQKPEISLNCFGVKSRMSLSQWQQKGWIYAPDPRGWFQWYCRYYMGRRIPEIDTIQIKRWKNFKRHLIQLKKHCSANDLTCRPKQRQALLQWAYNPFLY